MKWDVVVIGAGAAGLLAAIRSAERGKSTLLLEKTKRPGAKILMSGGTRCNITQNTDSRGIVAAFGRPGKFLHSALAALGPTELVQLFEAEGVATKVEETGKIFPASDKAAHVLAALTTRLARTDCQLATEEPVLNLECTESGFRISTARRAVEASKVIVTTGGLSYPGCGTTGDGYPWMQALGHEIVQPVPALTPVTTNESWVSELSGITIPDVAVQVLPPPPEKGKRKPLIASRTSFLMTHFGMSGPAILNVSRAISSHPRPNTLTLECDFLPALSADHLEHELQQQFDQERRKLVAGIVGRHIPKRLAETIIQRLALEKTTGAELSKKKRRAIVVAIKQSHIPVSGTKGFKKAEVTAGGVALREVDSSTMQSKIVPNLFLAGEILDLDGPIGGYNFQAAFSTAWLAGSHV